MIVKNTIQKIKRKKQDLENQQYICCDIIAVKRIKERVKSAKEFIKRHIARVVFTSFAVGLAFAHIL